MARSKGKPQRIEEYRGETSRDHKVLTPHNVVGQKIAWVYDTDRSWDRYPSDVTAPDGNHLFNFDMPVGELGPLLVLDNYGDEELEGEMRKRLLRDEMFNSTIGIYRETGEIVRVGFIEEYVTGQTQVRYSATTWDPDWSKDGLFVPAGWRKQLDKLKSQKRPFRFSVDTRMLLSFIDQEASYGDLRNGLTVELNFPEARLELSNLGFRVVTPWV